MTPSERFSSCTATCKSERHTYRIYRYDARSDSLVYSPIRAPISQARQVKEERISLFAQLVFALAVIGSGFSGATLISWKLFASTSTATSQLAAAGVSHFPILFLGALFVLIVLLSLFAMWQK